MDFPVAEMDVGVDTAKVPFEQFGHDFQCIFPVSVFIQGRRFCDRVRIAILGIIERNDLREGCWGRRLAETGLFWLHAFWSVWA